MLVVPFLRALETKVSDVYFETGLSFFAKPRFASYQHRFVLIPKDVLLRKERWEPLPEDLVDWCRWAKALEHIILFSTFKSGASVPFVLHAQSIPLANDDGLILTSLLKVRSRVLIGYGEMPHFTSVQIREILDYPAAGLQFRCGWTDDGLTEAARKVIELAINYDGNKTYNLLIVPAKNGECTINFFPRAKRSESIVGKERWQVGSFEFNGLLQAPSMEVANALKSSDVIRMFRKCGAQKEEFRELVRLINTF